MPREPDFESKYPSITALCRKSKFAPRREKGDIVTYLSYKGKYDFDFIQDRPNESHWRFVAILEVICYRESHQEAADWYKKRNLRLPYNCMVQGTKPLSLDKTCSLASAGFKSLHEWDQSYWDTAQTYPVFLICKAQYLNLKDPPAMTEAIMRNIFGHLVGTQNPYCRVTQQQLDDLKSAYNIKC